MIFSRNTGNNGMKRSTWILLAVCACSLLTMACKNTAEVKRRILEMQQHDICLPLSELFLMDGNRVVFVGSPLINDRLNDLFWEVVDDHMVP